MSPEEKLDIGARICTPLLRKIRNDLSQHINNEDETTFRLNPMYSHGVLSPGRQVRTRLYFTSESHIHSLLSCLRYGGLCEVSAHHRYREEIAVDGHFVFLPCREIWVKSSKFGNLQNRRTGCMCELYYVAFRVGPDVCKGTLQHI